MNHRELCAELARAAEMTPVTADAVRVLSWWDIVLLKIGGLINPFGLGFMLTCLIGFPIFLSQSIKAFSDPIEIEDLTELRSCKNETAIRLRARTIDVDPITIRLPSSTFNLHPLRGMDSEAFVYTDGEAQLPGDEATLFEVRRRGFTGSWSVGSEHIEKLPERFRVIGRDVADDPIILVPLAHGNPVGKWLLVALTAIAGAIGLAFMLAFASGLRDAIKMIRSSDYCAQVINEELGLIA